MTSSSIPTTASSRYVRLDDGRDFGLVLVTGLCEDFSWKYPHPRSAGLELGVLVAVEVDEHLAKALDAAALADVVDHGDFLTTTAGDLDGAFDRIIMNPPFANGADIKHVLHALDLLAPGGRLVAVVADGPRQQERLRPVIEGRGGTWEALPADSFKEQGTSVRTALIVVEARS